MSYQIRTPGILIGYDRSQNIWLEPEPDYPVGAEAGAEASALVSQRPNMNFENLVPVSQRPDMNFENPVPVSQSQIFNWSSRQIFLLEFQL